VRQLREVSGLTLGLYPAAAPPGDSDFTKPQAAILKALQISAPPRIYQLKPAVEG
jgi:hypothetical protein